MKIIAASIDLSKIKETDKGQKFHPLTIMLNDEKDKFNNDVAIIEGMTKDERLSGVNKKYIGNGKTVYDKPKTTTNETDDTTGDLPF